MYDHAYLCSIDKCVVHSTYVVLFGHKAAANSVHISPYDEISHQKFKHQLAQMTTLSGYKKSNDKLLYLFRIKCYTEFAWLPIGTRCK